MKKNFLSVFFLFLFGLSITAGDYRVSVATEDDNYGTPEGGGGGGGCKPKVLVEQPNYSIIYNMRNKTLGLTAGCVKKCGHSCTIKFVQTPKFK